MIPLDLHRVATELDGRLAAAADALVTGPVVTDSRQVGPGALFVALRGEQQDGHRFVGAAADLGAVAALVDHQVDLPLPQIVVADTLRALQRLAAAVVAEARAHHRLRHVIGITGSAGKTTTKLMLGEILGGVAPTVVPEQSFNNEVGAPLTMLRVAPETEFLVSEMGANHRGDLRMLAGLCHPDLGVELQVGRAHIGEFGSQDAIRVAKQELVEALPPSGTAVLNADDARVRSMAAHTPAAVTWFGRDESADVRILSVRQDRARLEVVLRTPDTKRLVTRVGLIGEHNAYNVAAAVATARAAGIGDDACQAGLGRVRHGERWRMQLMPRPDGVLIVNDAYNASPGSMVAALETLAGFARQGHRTVAVLGAMGELGDESAAEHAKIGEVAARTDVDALVVVGEGARAIFNAAQRSEWSGTAMFVEDAAAAEAWLRPRLRSGDVVLVKSSNLSGLRLLGDRLAAEGGDRPAGAVA